jgi:hypothetical protein
MVYEMVIEEAIKRRFDVKIIKMNRSAKTMDLTAQTLSDHPYAGRRSWRLTQTTTTGTNTKEYMLETAEFNSFPWIVDYTAEMITDGEDARLNWERFLRRFVKLAKGTITDDSEITGKDTTFYKNEQVIRNNELAKKVL